MINEKIVGNGKVYLIAGGGKTYTDVAAKICRTNKDIESLIGSDSDKKLIKDIVESGHNAALEFDDFIFVIEAYARVTEVQMVRKRHASYMISSGRVEKHGKREMNVVIPEDIKKVKSDSDINPTKITLKTTIGKEIRYLSLQDLLPTIQRQFGMTTIPTVSITLDYKDILGFIDDWYNTGVEMHVPEEDLRYMKPQATEFRAVVKMNAEALRDWAKIRMCNRAQTEIRDLCTKMIKLAKEAAPELMEGVGPNCVCYGYCAEKEQCKQMKGKIPTKANALKFMAQHKDEIINMGS